MEAEVAQAMEVVDHRVDMEVVVREVAGREKEAPGVVAPVGEAVLEVEVVDLEVEEAVVVGRWQVVTSTMVYVPCFDGDAAGPSCRMPFWT